MRRPPLRTESLEPRETPAVFGTPWPDGQHLTLSFARDGTPVAGQSSSLSTLLAQLSSTARLDVLRAFQTWAVQAGLNIGLVADDGSAFGAGGAVQGDPRFGDVRVGGVPLAPDVLAVTAPYNLYDNYSGNVVVNTAAGYGAGVDLFTVFLQEAGHALGVGNSPDPASAMYEFYQGARSGLSAGDVAAVRGLYGARPADQFEGAAGNDTLARATRYGGTLTADLTTTGDVDVYRFTTGLLTSGVTVSLRAAGLSLVAARVEALDSAGRVVASAAVTDPTQNDITLSLGSVRSLSTYYVRLSAARGDVFGVGAYELTVKNQSLLSDVVGVVTSLLDETGLNDTLVTATSLLTGVLSVGPQTEFSTDGGFGSASDVDYYRLTVPPAAGGGPVNLLATVWGKGGAALNSGVEVYDAWGHRLAADVLTADANTTTIQVRGLTPGQTYFVRVASDTHTRGEYHLSADLSTNTAQVPSAGGATLDAANPAMAATFHLAQSGQVHFVLTAEGPAGAGRSVELIVRAADGTVAARVVVPVGRARSVDVFLRAGNYRIEVRTTDASVPVAFQLGVAVVTDPTGATPVDPTTTPEQPPSDPPSSDPPPPSDPNDPPPDPEDGPLPPGDDGGGDTEIFPWEPGGATWP
jgi:hypothetical protein